MKENQINKIVKLYIIFSIFYSLIGRVIPIKQLIGEGVNSLIYILLAGIGALLLLVDLFTTKKWYKGKYIIVLYSFVVIIGISSLINIKYGFSDNLKTIVWTTIQIGLIYTFYTRFSREELIRFFDKMWVAMSTFWFFPVIISLVQFVICKGYITKVEGRRLRQGFYDNRLFGLFNDPNYAAITSLCVIVAMLYLLKKVTNKILNVNYSTRLLRGESSVWLDFVFGLHAEISPSTWVIASASFNMKSSFRYLFTISSASSSSLGPFPCFSRYWDTNSWIFTTVLLSFCPTYLNGSSPLCIGLIQVA